MVRRLRVVLRGLNSSNREVLLRRVVLRRRNVEIDDFLVLDARFKKRAKTACSEAVKYFIVDFNLRNDTDLPFVLLRLRDRNEETSIVIFLDLVIIYVEKK